jgi:DNA modification methylase
MQTEKWQVEWVPLKSIKLDPKNRNKHPKEQIERLAKLMGHYGWVGNPIVVSTSTKICKAGEGRYLAAKQVGLTEVPVHFKTFANEDDEYGWGIEDNGIGKWASLDFAGINEDIAALGPDFDIDLLGLKDFVIEPADKEGQGDPDEVPEPKPPVVKLGEVYLLGNHRLMCGDSTCQVDVATLMDGHKADMVFTDPPYGVNYSHEQTGRERIGDGKRPKYEIKNDLAEDLPGLLNGFISAMKPFLKEDWSGYMFYSGNKVRENINALENNGIRIGQYLVWLKNNHALSYFKYQYIHEPFLFIGPGSNVKPNGRWYGDFQTTVWEIGKDTDLMHPTQKPVELSERAALHVTLKNDNVFEPFCGSGSTLIGCEKTNRRCFGMEIDPIYCGVILDRWAKFTGKDPHREDGTAWSTIKANGQA